MFLSFFNKYFLIKDILLIQLLCFGGYVNFAIVVMPNLYFTYAIKCGTMLKEEGTQLKRLTKKFIIIGGCRYYGKIYTTKRSLSWKRRT